jgi:hypothetical protein
MWIYSYQPNAIANPKIATSTITTIITTMLMTMDRVLLQKVDAKTLTSTKLLLSLQHGTCQKSNT